MTGTQKLLALKARCHTIVPVFGGRHNADGNLIPLRHAPRNKFDPRPWTDGFFRWSSRELEAVAQHKPEVSDAQWIEQRHYADLDGTDAAFTHMFDRKRELAGVAG